MVPSSSDPKDNLSGGETGTFLDPTVTVVNVGTQLGPYRIEAPLGKGGMGEVFQGIDTRLDRRVAIKLSKEKFSERFEREARAISALNHPNVCTLYDVGTSPSGVSYLVMELVEGETLAALLKRGKLSLSETLKYGSHIADALAAAHAKGITHRDLKPANIMVTNSGVKVLDFGLAKSSQDASMTASHAVMGTPAYMAPEQWEAKEADARTDLFALGLVLYEMVAGRLPFPGASLGGMLVSGSAGAIPWNSGAAIPPGLEALITKLLAKIPADRCQSAAEVGIELSATADRLAAPPVPVGSSLLRPAILIPAAAALLLAVVGGTLLYRQAERQNWARATAMPEIEKLKADGKPLAAFRVLLDAELVLPGDAGLAQLAKSLTRYSSVKSATPGATVEIQDYAAPDGPWYALGVTPLEHVRMPDGYFRWRLSKAGMGEFVSAPSTADAVEFPSELGKSVEAGMVHLPGGPWGDLIGFIGWIGFQLPAFDMDQFEVTNGEYQKFVDAGGYQKQEYWREKFRKDGKELTWDQAMTLFRDPTGRPGPATWEAGHFPEGKADYPVSGVSWYEASAYAAFVGKTLPALGQWFKAAPAQTAGATTAQSNFGTEARPARASHSVGVYGTYDLIGNVREWCLNATDRDERFILGGAWGTQTYQSFEPEALPPFDRSPTNGFRGVRSHEPLPAAAAAPIVRLTRDFSHVKPATDEVFQVYKSLYAYDKRPLNPSVQGVIEDTPSWTKEKLTIDAGYDRERLPLYLFLPKNVRPPYQTVVFFPSARVNFVPNSQTLGDMDFVDYVIKSGRALAYPVYRVTYERHLQGAALPGAVGDREMTIQQSKEVRRTLDYLETRPDIDKDKFAYMGVSQGTAYGIIFTALEDRFKAVIFADGGYFLTKAVAGRDQADFAPRLKKPVLMVNGKYDYTFPPDQSQIPMFNMIGTAPADKVRKVFETPHDVSQVKPELALEVLAFLDKYLGRVN